MERSTSSDQKCAQSQLISVRLHLRMSLRFVDVRMCALEALVDYTVVDGKWEDLEYLMDIAEEDPDPGIRLGLLRLLISNPPFKRGHPKPKLDKPELVHRLWKLFK